MKKIFLSFILVLLVSGCSIPIKKIELSPGSKITVAVHLSNNLKIQTIGTTVFQNKSMQSNVNGQSLSTRVRQITDNSLANSTKIKLIKSKGALDTSSTIVMGPWDLKLIIPDKTNLLKKAKSSGANYLLLLTGSSRQDPLFGTNQFVDDIGVVQRSAFGTQSSAAYAALSMLVFDTSSGKLIKTSEIFTSSRLAGHKLITPKALPNAVRINELIKQIPLKTIIDKTLSDVGLR